MLVFLLIAVVLNAMRRTHSNLLDLQLRMLGVEPVFAGQAAQFRIWLEHTTQRPRYGIELSAGGDSSLVIEYWSNGKYNKRNMTDQDTIKLIEKVKNLRDDFQQQGGVVKHISGDVNPADLGFHK